MSRLALRLLRKQRAKRFMQDMAPHLRLAGNYLPGLFFSGIVLLFLYDRLLQGLPERFPFVLVCALTLAHGMSAVSVRTYLLPADVQYLLPLESRMGAYFAPGLLNAMLMQAIKISLYGIMAWPLYRLSPESEGRLLIVNLAWLWVMKGLTVLLWWEEQRLRNRRTRFMIAGIRTISTFFAMIILLTWSSAWTGLVLGLASLLHVVGLLAANKSTVAWERLIALEKRRRKRWRTLIRQFAELPGEHPQAANNPLARLARFIPLRRKHAYRYLYLITWLRSPIFGMMLRWIVIGFLIELTADRWWLQGGVALLFAVVLRYQLRELERYHQFEDWSFVFPIQQADRASAIRKLCLHIWGVSALLLCLPMLVRLT